MNVLLVGLLAAGLAAAFTWLLLRSREAALRERLRAREFRRHLHLRRSVGPLVRQREQPREDAGRLLADKGFDSAEIQSIQRMIRCTDMRAHPQDLPFRSAAERTVAFAVGTADLLGQMAAPDYIDKLGILYEEFAESARFDSAAGKARAGFSSAEDLIRKTPGFWSHWVLPRVEQDFAGVHRFLSEPLLGQPETYLARIERNLARLNRPNSVAA